MVVPILNCILDANEPEDINDFVMIQLYHLVNRRGSIVSLRHEFAIIEKDSKENFIDTNMNPVSIPDVMVLYMNDSFQWVDTCWNGKKKEKDWIITGIQL